MACLQCRLRQRMGRFIQTHLHNTRHGPGQHGRASATATASSKMQSPLHARRPRGTYGVHPSLPFTVPGVKVSGPYLLNDPWRLDAIGFTSRGLRIWLRQSPRFHSRGGSTKLSLSTVPATLLLTSTFAPTRQLRSPSPTESAWSPRSHQASHQRLRACRRRSSTACAGSAVSPRQPTRRSSGRWRTRRAPPPLRRRLGLPSQRGKDANHSATPSLVAAAPLPTSTPLSPSASPPPSSLFLTSRPGRQPHLQARRPRIKVERARSSGSQSQSL